MNDLHALIARLADELDMYHQHVQDDRTARHSLAAEARAALAEPQGEGTGNDLPAPISERDLEYQWNQQADEFNPWHIISFEEQLAFAQAHAIAADRARWGRPTNTKTEEQL